MIRPVDRSWNIWQNWQASLIKRACIELLREWSLLGFVHFYFGIWQGRSNHIESMMTLRPRFSTSKVQYVLEKEPGFLYWQLSLQIKATWWMNPGEGALGITTSKDVHLPTRRALEPACAWLNCSHVCRSLKCSSQAESLHIYSKTIFN